MEFRRMGLSRVLTFLGGMMARPTVAIGGQSSGCREMDLVDNDQEDAGDGTITKSLEVLGLRGS